MTCHEKTWNTLRGLPGLYKHMMTNLDRIVNVFKADYPRAKLLGSGFTRGKYVLENLDDAFT